MAELKSCLKPRRQSEDLTILQIGTTKQRIPELKSMAPAIFVPLTDDLLTPPPPTNTELDELKASLTEFNKYSSAVRDNMLNLFQQEARRIFEDIQAKRVQLRTQGMKEPPLPRRIAGWEPTREDLENMVENLATRANNNQDYNIQQVPEVNFARIDSLPDESPGETYTKELLKIVGNGAVELRAYDRYVYGKRVEMERRIREVEGPVGFNPPSGPRAHRA